MTNKIIDYATNETNIPTDLITNEQNKPNDKGNGKVVPVLN
jgi:hypothetical protein